MKRIFLLVITSLLFSACSTDGKPVRERFTSRVCVDADGKLRNLDGHTTTKIRYGDGQIVVRPISKARPNTEFRIKLIPKRRPTDKEDYTTVKVTVTGKNLASRSTGDAKWIKVSGSFNDANKGRDKGVLVAGCPPLKTNPDERDSGAIEILYYEVEVENVGKLDPRLEVGSFGG